MTKDYLDIGKSVMISSPAGSGKTEKLARRYISLLGSGSAVERILAITFTEKAAAEMKERILNILRLERPEMFDKIREKMPRMRISTIHSFCLKLLKRFSVDLGLDPSLEVMDDFDGDMLWSEAVYESLKEDGVSGERLFYGIIRDGGVKGWNTLYGLLAQLHAKRPHIEFWLRSEECGMRNADPEETGAGNVHFRNVIVLYKRCLDRYRKKKRERRCLDYNDLELLAYEAISLNREWQNILFSFDEHTDHILVDEFQDTSSFQWKIIDKLTEEWRSGLGSKREAGKTPTIFLVGDDKQSIYSFRGANVGVFRNAGNKLSEWLGEEYAFIEARENYRSLPAIVDFVNVFFGRLMPRGLHDGLKTEYASFDATRQGDGAVELSIIEGNGNVRDDRRTEANYIAGRIRRLHESLEVFEGDRKRRCLYGDMAILLRGRTHLSAFEYALRTENIPFVIVKGIGFYNAPEVALLKSILFFLINPEDDYSLFNILRSPLFSLDYRSLRAVARKAASGPPAGSLYSRLDSLSVMQPVKEGMLQARITDRIKNAVSCLRRWRAAALEMPYSAALEEILNETSAWRYLYEKPRYVNAKKFIRLVEKLESDGLAGLEMRENLIRAAEDSDEPKANINTDAMDAVKIMTVHASKGLQFPVVFLPCLDETGKPGGSGIVMDEEGEGEGISIAYEDDPEKRKTMPIFLRQKEKQSEEEKRLFYVASTRAMDCLCMSGVLNDRPKGKLSYLFDAFNLALPHPGETIQEFPFRITRIRTEDIEKQPAVVHEPRPRLRSGARALRNEAVFIEPIDRDYRPLSAWHDVTEETEAVRKKHGDNWVVLGRIFHRLFEGISKAAVSPDDISDKLEVMLWHEMVSGKKAEAAKELIVSDIERLRDAGILESVVMPRADAYSELPFILQKGGTVYRGRIDRIIVRDGSAFIYDYKTYPAAEDEIPELAERYAFQMGLYKEAITSIFSLKAEAFLLFTHELLTVPI